MLSQTGDQTIQRETTGQVAIRENGNIHLK